MAFTLKYNPKLKNNTDCTCKQGYPLTFSTYKIIKAQRKLHPSFLKKNNNIGVNKNNTYKSLINHKGSSIGEHGNPFVKSPNKLYNINNGERVSYKYSMFFPCKAIPITFVITNKR